MSKQTPPANLRGWGQGYPVDRSKDMKWVRATRSGARWQVHEEIAPLIEWLVNEVEQRGYLFDHGPEDTDDDWGYANRPIRGSTRPSNHSWGLAIDIDAQEYPMGQSRRNPPRWIIDLFARYRFDWGGVWRRPDPMHFEFNGWPRDARWLIASLAAHHVAVTPPPVPISVPPPPPPPPPVLIRRKPMYLLQARGDKKVWLTDGMSKVHVIHPDFVVVHQRQLKRLGLPTEIVVEHPNFVDSIRTRV